MDELSISNCPKLTKIHPYAFVENSELRRVDLSLNQLETLSPETLRWDKLDYLNLAGNPWNCNCSLLTFLPNALRRIKRSGNRAVCIQPEQMLGVELSNAVSLFYYAYCASHNYGNKIDKGALTCRLQVFLKSMRHLFAPVLSRFLEIIIVFYIE